LSNLGQKEEITKGLDLGADSFMIKAHFTPSQIVEEIKNTLNNPKKPYERINELPAGLGQIPGATIKKEASDLHFCVGYLPSSGLMILFGRSPANRNCRRGTTGAGFSLMTQEQQNDFVKNKEIDFSYAFRTNTGSGQCFLPKRFRFGGAPPDPGPHSHAKRVKSSFGFKPFIEATQGFVMVTGPSSHGKSTTLAALIDSITMSDAIISSPLRTRLNIISNRTVR